jgi:methionyl-tRNA formyltransferase
MEMRVAFVAPEEPSIIPLFFERVLPSLDGAIVAVAVVSPIYRGSTWTSQALRFIRAFGVTEFLREGGAFGVNKGLDLVKRASGVGRFHSIRSMARQHRIPVLSPDDVNDPAFLGQLRSLDPDLIVSVSCPQIFKEELLSLPRRGCVNVHSGMLPEYRGMLPTFWVLANGESRTGVTAHFMAPGIDGGDIILQRPIEIEPDDTLRSLMVKAKTKAAEVVLDTISLFDAGPVPTQPNPVELGSYHSFPTRADVARFRSRGRKLR